MKKLVTLSLLCAVAFILTGCAGMMSAKFPVYQRMDKETAGSTLVLNQTYDPWAYNLYLEATIDGYAVTDKRYLSMGRTALALDSGSHELRLTPAKERFDIGWLPKEPLVLRFNTEQGKKYQIDISRKARWIIKLGFKLEYSGWNRNEAARFPSEYY